MKGVDSATGDREGMTHKPIVTCKISTPYIYVNVRTVLCE